MSGTSSIRRVHPADAPALVALRREALENEPFAFSSSLADDRGLKLAGTRRSLAADDRAVFGHFTELRLTGMVGVMRTPKTKQRHRATIWGMYVSPAARRAGVGRALLEAAIAHARTWSGVEQVHLTVTDPAEAARRLYERAGFHAWGHAPRALQWDGRFVDEFHLILEL